METFKSKETDRIYFKNLQRVDEALIFQKAKKILESDQRIKFTKYQEIIEYDIWNGLYGDIEFELTFDMNYGTTLRCAEEHALNELESLLNSN